MMPIDDLLFDPSEALEGVNSRLVELGLSDGLPCVPPTSERIDKMIAGREPKAVLTRLPPFFAEATIYRIAVCAIMAGCEPAQMPVLLSAVEALGEPNFNLLGIQTTTGAAAPAFVINGPAAARLGINGGANALGPGSRANAAIGRALSLILRNIGGAIPGELDMATMGQPGKYTFCFSENEQASPWEPLHVSRGYKSEQSTVTVIATAGTMEVRDDRSRAAESLLMTFAQSMLSAGSIGGSGFLCGGRPLLLLAPDHAAIIGRTMSRRQTQGFLFQQARLPLSALAPEMCEYLTQRGAQDEHGMLHVAPNPEDILLVVVGGTGNKSTYIPTWGGGLPAVTREIRLDQ